MAKYGKKKPMGGGMKKKGKGSVDSPSMSPVYSGRGSGADGSVKTKDRKDCLMPGDNRQGKMPAKGPVFE